MLKKVVDNRKVGWYYIRALERAQELRSLKTEQETSIQKQKFQETTNAKFVHRVKSNGEFDPGSG